MVHLDKKHRLLKLLGKLLFFTGGNPTISLTNDINRYKPGQRWNEKGDGQDENHSPEIIRSQTALKWQKKRVDILLGVS